MPEHPPTDVLAREWEVWASDNLLRGVPRAEIEARLHIEGISSELALGALDALERSPMLEAARPFVRDARRWVMFARLRERLERDAARPGDVVRRSGLSAEEFFDLHYAPGTPVILTDLVPRWPAFERWTPSALAERFGDELVDITVDRDSDPTYAGSFRRRTEKVPFRDFAARISSSTTATNDFYMVAQNHALRGPLAAMLDDVAMPDGWMAEERLASGASLWMGPAGTVTALHHDLSSLLACQVYGRKRWRLIPPTERALLDRVRGPHTTLDPECDPMDGVLVKDVVLEAGEALFVPLGWWHHVRALDASISISLTGFPRDNEHRFFQPGAA